MSEIASKVNISRQRVYQILREEGLPTKRYLKMTQYACAVCGTISTHKFCSDECKKKWHQIPVICTRCGKLFIRNRHQFLTNYPHFNNNLFCSRDCSSKWWAEHYGFKAYPDHISNKPHTRKHNWDDIWKMHLETGYHIAQLGALLCKNSGGHYRRGRAHVPRRHRVQGIWPADRGRDGQGYTVDKDRRYRTDGRRHGSRHHSETRGIKALLSGGSGKAE